MSLGNIFVKSVVREIGRNYGKAISNDLLGSKHSTPIRVVENYYLGNGTGGRNYKHNLERICKTWTIKGSTATFNVAQNMYKSFFDLVDEAQADNEVNIDEILQLMQAFVMAHPQLVKVIQALKQQDRDDLAKKVDELDDSIFDFFNELNKNFVLPEEPKGFFNKKKKERWKYYKSIKDNLEQWVNHLN